MSLNKKKIISVSAILLLIIVVFFVLRHFITYPLLHVAYNGKVTNVRFDVKGYSYFQINDKFEEYEMHYLNCDLQLGDSMAKKMDDGYIYHYRDGKLIGVYGACFGHRYK